MKSKMIFPIALIASLSCSFMANAEPQKEDIGQWRVYSETDINKPSLKALLYSIEGEDAALGVRCEKKRPELYFMLSDRLPQKTASALAMKADGQPITIGKWQRASQGNGAFSLAPLAILAQLQGKNGLILTYQTERGTHQVSAFYLNGIDRVIDKFSAYCRIKPQG